MVKWVPLLANVHGSVCLFKESVFSLQLRGIYESRSWVEGSDPLVLPDTQRRTNQGLLWDTQF